MNEHRDFLRELASAQDELMRRGSILVREKQRLRREAPRRSQRQRRRIVPILLALALAASAVWLLRPQPALTFAVGQAEVTGEVGAAIIAPEAGALDLRFSDGSRLTLGPSGRARVTALQDRGAAIVVERGHADVSVVPRANGRWRVDVGPFAIHVKGTRFSFDWDPATERLSFELHKGAVEITAPCLAGGRSLVAGDSLRASCRAAPPPPTAAVLDTPQPTAAESVAPSPAPKPAVKTLPSWRQLAAAHDYRAALDAALARGFDAECRRSSASDLLLLGDAARLAGDPLHALQAYGASHRKRDASGRSAFAMGLVEFDQRQRYRSAAEWFAVYVREQPRGALVEEAEGRLIEAWQRADEPAQAKQAASAYLARYPAGQYADLAHRMKRIE